MANNKSMQREGLHNAAADTFSEGATPAQSLLKTLQASEALRRENYSNTLDARMKAAKDKLPGLHPKHPVQSDEAIFGQPHAAVHALLPDVRQQQGSTEGIKAMQQSKEARHEATWQQYVAERDIAAHALEQAVAAAVNGLKANLDASNSQIQQDMSVLSDDKVMVLDEAAILAVWDSVAQRSPQRTAWLEGLEGQLEAAEASRRGAVEGALAVMVAAMNEVAFLDEGQVERLLEAEALALNMAILENRQSAADLLKRLHIAEVEFERKRRTTWETALASWRRLRTHHAISLFNTRLTSSEFAEPPARLALFADIRGVQQEAADKLTAHMRTLPSLLPPRMDDEAVAVWREAAVQLLREWDGAVDVRLEALRVQDHALEQQAQDAYAALQAEAATYRGYSSEELTALLESQCTCTLQHRRQAAQALLEATKAYTARQTSQWRAAADTLGRWMAGLTGQFLEGKRKYEIVESGVRAALREAQELFDVQDADREAALEAAIAAVKQGSSEKVLDAKVADALACLDTIQAGYRAHHTSICAVVRAHSGMVSATNEAYKKALCQTLQLQPAPPPQQQQQQQQQQGLPLAPTALASPTAAVADSKTKAPATKPASRPTSGTAASRAAGRMRASSAASSAALPAVAEAAPAPEVVEVPGGGRYQVIVDLLQTLLEESKKSVEAAAVQAQSDSTAAATAFGQKPPAESAAAAVAAAAEAATPAKPAAPKPKVTKAQEEEAAAAAAVAAAAAAVEAAAAAAAAAARPAAPLGQEGQVLVQEMPLPKAQLRVALCALQVGMLSEMELFAARTQATAETWATEREGAFTEGLDAQLRRHRPRAGRVEEEVRAQRSVELMAQRRKAEGHMARQSKAVKQQQAGFADGLSQLRKDAAAWAAKLRGAERLLGNALSTKGIDICWREAEALRARCEKDLAARVAVLKVAVEEGCAAVVAANRSFEGEHLRTFEEGGQYAADNVATYKRGIAGIDHHMAQQQAAQLAETEAAAGMLSGELSTALQAVQALVPSHKEDMNVIEATDRALDAARKKARTELARNSEAASSISSQLNRLEALLAQSVAAAAAAASTPTVAHAKASATLGGTLPGTAFGMTASSTAKAKGAPATAAAATASTAGGESGATTSRSTRSVSAAGGRVHCERILQCVDALRVLLVAQADALDCLKSKSLRAGLAHTAQQGAGAAAGAASQGAAGRAAAGSSKSAAAVAPKADVPTNRPDTAGSTSSADDEAPDAPTIVATPLFSDIQAVISACKVEVDAAAKAYYAAKDPARPAKYPARIPATAEELLAATDSVLDQLRQQLGEHVAAGTKELRLQVVHANRLLETVPAAAMSAVVQNLLADADAQHAALVQGHVSSRGATVAAIEANKRTLHPSMLHPNRQHELDELKAKETSRQQAAKALTAACAKEALLLVQQQVPQLHKELTATTRRLLQLLDGFLMPADLAPMAEGDDTLAGVQRRNLKQLQRLALAQEEAAAAGTGAAHADGKAGSKGDAKAIAGTTKSGGGKASKGGEEPSDRPFSRDTWALPAGQFDLASLGWTDQHSRTIAGIADIVPGAAAPPSEDVTAVDTPCQRACIRAHRACIQAAEARLQAVVGQHQARLLAWCNHEGLWAATWDRLLDELDAA